jgi:hypothetical protein
MPRDARILTVNGVGTFIWDAIGDHTVATLAQAVTERFEVDYDQALVDTRSFLESLLDRGLVICPKVVHATADERDA